MVLEIVQNEIKIRKTLLKHTAEAIHSFLFALAFKHRMKTISKRTNGHIACIDLVYNRKKKPTTQYSTYIEDDMEANANTFTQNNEQMNIKIRKKRRRRRR